jgi:hypothetical protein
VQWRPDLDNPLRQRGQDDDDEPVLRPMAPGSHPDDAAWHLVGIGVENQP